MARKNSTIVASASIETLRDEAVAAVAAIDTGYSAASKAIMALVLGARGAKVTPPVFASALANVEQAVPSVAKVTVGAYISNARRIFACPSDKWAEAQKVGGVESLKALAAACPAVQKAKAEGAAKRAEAAGQAAAASKGEPAPVKVSTPATDPLLALQNDLVSCRKLFANKRAVLALLGEMEDMLDDIKRMAKTA